ncbi:mechanosensitive ion channel [Sphingomonas aliaeris]|uniref:Small-conductance mechanosensitive channel n=1 Tax=Sphingomonas aliaeris TaxID=2759526 RepID=A0A974NW00_9SPHN|nr:mechanosensitive ion channel [Sphingomonas aliaeris]QQV77940.1 mechanosensitive ion channel [Sphingomonas aliaeris]
MQPNYVTADGMIASTRNLGDTAMLYAQEWGPRILAAAVILLIGYLVAKAAKWGVAALVNKTPLARHAHRHSGVPEAAGRHPKSVGAQVGDAAFWIVILIALVLAAQPLGLAAATSPIGRMLNGFGAAIPNIIGAVLIFFVGYIVASVAKKAIEAVLTAARTEQIAERAGMPKADPTTLPRMFGGIVFALIIIPVAIAALDQLNIRAISDPATAMLRIILDSIPHVIAAAIILALAYVIGRFASQLLAQFLSSTGFDRTIAALGIFPSASAGTTTAAGVPPTSAGASATPALVPSKLLGNAVFVAIIIFGLMEAFRQLNFAYGSQMMAEILTLLGSVIFGAVIIAAAVAISKLVATVVRASGGANAELTAKIVQIAIIVLGTAIGLRFMGLADDIINLAFGLILGAIAVAFALAFGLGGRDAAARMVQKLAGSSGGESIPPAMSTTLRPGTGTPPNQGPQS